MKLEPSANIKVPSGDKRPLIPPPLPVRLVAIEDVRLLAFAGSEAALDAFYVGLWEFERDTDEPGVVYRADNFRIRFEIVEPPVIRQELRPVQIEVRSLPEAEHKLVEAEIDYIRQKGISAGSDSLLFLDPAGNWVALLEVKGIM
jgi:hypothetical protein